MTSNAFMAQLPESWKRRFYFISGRGIPEGEAKTILVEGFWPRSWRNLVWVN